MQPETDGGSTLQSTNPVAKSFFQAPGPGLIVTPQAQKLEFPAFAYNPDDTLLFVRGGEGYTHTFLC